MKTLIVVLFLLTSISASGALNDVVDYTVKKEEKKTSKQNDISIETPITLQQVLGYGASAPMAGLGYTADGLYYLSAGSVATAVGCWPVFAAILATKSYVGTATATSLCIHLGWSFDKLAELHPHLGDQIWKSTQSWREP